MLWGAESEKGGRREGLWIPARELGKSLKLPLLWVRYTATIPWVAWVSMVAGAEAGAGTGAVTGAAGVGAVDVCAK